MENIVIKPRMGDIARSARERGKEEGEEKMEEIGRRERSVGRTGDRKKRVDLSSVPPCYGRGHQRI